MHIKKERGITLITLVITVTVMMIITVIIASNINNIVKYSTLTRLENDIKALNARISAYYTKNGTLPVLGEPYTKEQIAATIDSLSPNDGDEYYIIDLSKLKNIRLFYGKEYNNPASLDKYIINEQSHKIYYLMGVEDNESLTYTIGKEENIFLNEDQQEQSETQEINALLFNDGTLVFNKTGEVSIRYDESKLVKVYRNIQPFDSENSNPWFSDGYADTNQIKITKVDFEEEIKPTSTAYWFFNCSELVEFNHMSNLNICNVTSMLSMFYTCSNLTSIDLTRANTGHVVVMSSMFSDCNSLKTIYVSNGWNTANVTNSNSMFSGCTSLVGQSGTTYNSSYIDKTYAHIDGGVSDPGYLTGIF